MRYDVGSTFLFGTEAGGHGIVWFDWPPKIGPTCFHVTEHSLKSLTSRGWAEQGPHSGLWTLKIFQARPWAAADLPRTTLTRVTKVTMWHSHTSRCFSGPIRKAFVLNMSNHVSINRDSFIFIFYFCSTNSPASMICNPRLVTLMLGFSASVYTYAARGLTAVILVVISSATLPHMHVLWYYSIHHKHLSMHAPLKEDLCP